MKILTVVGARPQFIKAAAVHRIIRQRDGLEEVMVHTGQHFDENMSRIFFDELELPKPSYNLSINNLSHGAMTGRMLEALEQVMLKEQPALVLVYGDTNSTLAAALAAVKLHLPCAHVEAGLRSFNMRMPEEINRILTDRISDILFCPTDQAVENLHREGFGQFDAVLVPTGDVMIDNAIYYTAPERKASLPDHLPASFALCTFHREENTSDPGRLAAIIGALEEINKKIPVVIPMHPGTKRIMEQNKLRTGALVIPPLGYKEMLAALDDCSFVLTDSGGLQKEAYFFGKYCICLRDETEWVELSTSGALRCTGAEKAEIISAFEKMNTTKEMFSHPWYGGGNAAEEVVDGIHAFLVKRNK